MSKNTDTTVLDIYQHCVDSIERLRDRIRLFPEEEQMCLLAIDIYVEVMKLIDGGE